MTTQYDEFLRAKVKFQHEHGFAISADDVHPMALPHQCDMIRWAVQKGRAALFASYGLGKTLAQLEIMRLILAHADHAGQRALIVCPLGVRQEFLHDAQMLGYTGETMPTFVKKTADVGGPGLYLTNYESVRDGKLDPTLFIAVTLDEAAILRSYGSKTYQSFLQLFDSLRYRFVATATPSPNRYKELIHYAAYLGVMDSGQALTRFFQRDSEQANNLTLYPHMEGEFFAWLHSWALFLQSPADLGHDATRYTLPPLTIRHTEVSWERETVATERDGQGMLMHDASIGVQDAAREKRASLIARLATLHEMLDTIGDEPFIVWCDLNDEQAAVESVLRDRGITFASVHGGQDLDTQEAEVLAFKAGERQALIGKAVMLGAGVNLQRCATAVFLGVNHKYHDFAQAVHRIHRFLQTKPVMIHVLHTEAERGIVKNLQRKHGEDQELRRVMQELIQTYGLNDAGLQAHLTRSLGVERKVVSSGAFTAVHNDCVDESRRMGTNSVDLIVTSIPFGNHYEYSANYNDFGHNPDHEAFFAQMDFLTPELLRVLAPGRLACIHVKDRIRFGNVTGYGMPSVEPFHAECISHYRRHGFIYMGMITVVTDVVRENNQTYRLGWTEQCKDGSKMGVGSPEYVLLFRKLPTDRSKAYADVRVAKEKSDYTRARWQLDAHAFWRSSGDRLLTAEELGALSPDMLAKVYERHSRENVYDYRQHVQIGQALEDRGALPATLMSLAPASNDPDVWHDVVRMRTLNGAQSQRGLTNHVCPLQLDIVERLIHRYTNPGELVFDPFGGLGTVPYVAIKEGRRGYMSELNAEYFRDACRYLREAEELQNVPSLFDLVDAEAA
ncbi:DNA methyltransferase [Gemmatimonas sp.]|uniref:DNA methyltransferase n=1 Tax=Gemmatimonas sp. TaxID=1962908 RepID=UPI0033403224